MQSVKGTEGVPKDVHFSVNCVKSWHAEMNENLAISFIAAGI